MLKTTFASHPKSQFWSKRNNGSPSDYALNCHKKCWFDCECGHEFEMILKNINLRSSWCPYCCNKRLCGKCDVCYNKSFASHPKNKYFSSKNTTDPLFISLFTHKKYLFDCECGHEFETIISDITNNSSWCSYCSTPPKKLCSNNDCSKCFNKSFASHEKSQFWASKNTSHPRQIFKKTAAKYWFDCDKCNNSFESTISHISKGTWCPKCRYKTEDKLFKILLTIYPSITAQVKFDWCKDKKHLPFDFVLDDLKIIVELDGENHFIQVAKWKTPEHNRKRDLYKMKCANENGYSIIRILQDDIWHNRYEWLKDLTNNIDKIVADNRVQNIYMCKNDEYKDFDMLIPNL